MQMCWLPRLMVGLVPLLSLFVAETTQSNETCGLAAPDPQQICVSVRLPWNPNPIYFCTEKTKFKYRDQCHNRYSHCGTGNIRQDTLLIATPWDCCPITSDPDTCQNRKCPPPPLNRECHPVEPNPRGPHECCPTYFCEKDMTPQTCHFKRLESSCNTPPKDKSNCVPFLDSFGCCPKFYCDEDAKKPGECPAEVKAAKHMARYNVTDAAPENKTDKAVHSEAKASAEAGSNAGAHAPMMASKAAFRIGFFPQRHNRIDCIGDYNCPGNMKCCSSDMHVYLRDGRYTSRNRNPTHGYCTGPADKDGKESSQDD